MIVVYRPRGMNLFEGFSAHNQRQRLEPGPLWTRHWVAIRAMAASQYRLSGCDHSLDGGPVPYPPSSRRGPRSRVGCEVTRPATWSPPIQHRHRLGGRFHRSPEVGFRAFALRP